MIWACQYTGEWEKADLTQYPTYDQTRAAWNEGIYLVLYLTL
jgi:hypothetical protein